MKQRALLFSLAAGAACLALRLLQNHIGFEADTRLPVPGSFPALLLPLLLPQPVIPAAITAANVMAISCFFIMCSSKFFVFYVTFARSGSLFVRPD